MQTDNKAILIVFGSVVLACILYLVLSLGYNANAKRICSEPLEGNDAWQSPSSEENSSSSTTSSP